jgi:putative Mg2+ transporter-C (MgtC) family protein
MDAVTLSPSAVMPLSHLEILLRLGGAFLAGMALGFEREGHGRAAGLKTMILAASAAAVAMILGDHLYRESFLTPGAVFRPDRGRLAAGILTGIGFLGAGAILRKGASIRGVTTGAVLWTATILGMSFGSGAYFVGFIGLVISLIVLFLLPRLESKLRRDHYAQVLLTLDPEAGDESEWRSVIEGMGFAITGLERDVRNSRGRIHLTYFIRSDVPAGAAAPMRLIQTLAQANGVRRVQWK